MDEYLLEVIGMAKARRITEVEALQKLCGCAYLALLSEESASTTLLTALDDAACGYLPEDWLEDYA